MNKEFFFYIIQKYLHSHCLYVCTFNHSFAIAESGAPVGGERVEREPTWRVLVCLLACELFLFKLYVSMHKYIFETYWLRQGSGCTVMILLSSFPLSSDDMYSFFATVSHLARCSGVNLAFWSKALSLSLFFYIVYIHVYMQMWEKAITFLKTLTIRFIQGLCTHRILHYVTSFKYSENIQSKFRIVCFNKYAKA